MRPAVLHAAAIRVLRWVQGQPPAAGFCPAVAEKEACARGQRLARWPGSGAGLQKPPSPGGPLADGVVVPRLGMFPSVA